MATQAQRNKLVRDILTRHQVYLERLKAGEVRKLDPALRSLDRAVRAALERLGDGASRTALNRTLSSLRSENSRILARYTNEVLAGLRQLSGYATSFHAATLRTVWPANAPPMSTPAASATWAGTLAQPVQATGDLLEPFVKNFSTRAINVIERTIRVGHAQGLTNQQILRMLRGTRAANYRDGLLGNLLKREGSAMIRTAIQQVNNSAQMAVFEANSDLVEEYAWVSTLDSRTSQTCRSLDGRTFKLGKGPIPPAHINCRSFIIPIVGDIDPRTGSKRASRGEEGGQQVDASLSYYEWLKTQSFAFQVDALGRTRAILFNKGGLSAKEFADLNLDRNFQPLTLEQMRKKNPEPFERAGIEL